MIRLIVILAGLLLPQTPRASIEGTVLFRYSGAPASGADVELTVVEGGKVLSRTTKTSANGRFSFSDLPPGLGYQIVARGTGFRPTAYGQRDSRDRWTSVALSAGQHMTDLRITVSGISQINGHVMERPGKALAGSTVVAMRPVYVEGRRALQRAALTVSNLLGEFRFSGLPPGRYYIRISPLNEAAVAPLFVDPALFDRTATAARRDEVPHNPEGYRTVYYPGVSIESAQPVQVEEGQIVSGVDTSVSRSRTGRLRGTVTEGVPSRRVLTSEVSLLPADRSPDSSASRFFTSRDGTFEIRAIQPGMYFLNAVAAGPEGGLAGRMLVEIPGGETATVDVRVSPVGNISGRMSVEGLLSEVPNLSALSVTLIPNVRGPVDREQSQPPVTFPSVTGAVLPEGAFTLNRVLPGDYRLTVSPKSGAYIKSIRFGDKDAPDGVLHVDGNAARSLEIVLGTDTGSLDGRVLDGTRQNAKAARVVLVPESRQRQDLYLAVSTSETGRFQMSGIAPGRYNIFAWESAPEGAWMDSDFLKVYQNRGTAIEISSQAPEYAEVTVIRE